MIAGRLQTLRQRIWHSRRTENGIDNGSQIGDLMVGTEIDRSASALTLNDYARRGGAAHDTHLTRCRATVGAWSGSVCGEEKKGLVLACHICHARMFHDLHCRTGVPWARARAGIRATIRNSFSMMNELYSLDAFTNRRREQA